MTLFDELPFVRPSPFLLLVDAAIVAFFAAIGVVWMTVVASRTDNRVARWAHGLFTAYLVAVACLVFLPLHGIRAAADSFGGTEPLQRAWHWGLRIQMPLADGGLDRQRVANVLMTIPFGFGFGLLAPRLGVRRIFAACVGWALSIELAQLGVSVLLGFVYRTFDVNDIIDNVLGALIGLGLFVALALLVRARNFGHGRAETTVAGFIRDSVDRYFAGHRARRPPSPGH